MRLSDRSEHALRGVHPQLVAVVRLAVEITEQDFTVFEGVRTPQKQAEYLAKGVAKTANSKHLIQQDGFGHAVDLVPYIDGLRWEWPPIYVIAEAMLRASADVGVQLVWGATWDRLSTDLPRNRDQIKREVEAYCVRHPGPDFLDGPHWQLV